MTRRQKWKGTSINNSQSLNTIHSSVTIDDGRGITLYSHFAGTTCVPYSLQTALYNLFQRSPLSQTTKRREHEEHTSNICSSVCTSGPGKYSSPITICCINLLANACRARLYAATATC